MANSVHEAVEPASSPDAEKHGIYTTTTTDTTPYADQIPHEMMETLAPNGEADFIRAQINAMSEEEALAIIQESLEFHSDDWNFPADMRARMQKCLDGGPKGYGEWYERDLRIDAVMMKYSSPYPGVRAVASPLDDEDVPVETLRAYFLGVGWAIIGTFMATFFNSRFPGIGTLLLRCLFPCFPPPPHFRERGAATGCAPQHHDSTIANSRDPHQQPAPSSSILEFRILKWLNWACFFIIGYKLTEK